MTLLFLSTEGEQGSFDIVPRKIAQNVIKSQDKLKQSFRSSEKEKEMAKWFHTATLHSEQIFLVRWCGVAEQPPDNIAVLLGS